MSPWQGTLALYEHRDGVQTEVADAITYDVVRNEAHFGPVDVQGHALVWLLQPGVASATHALLAHTVSLDDSVEWVARCDRIDFPPGGVAFTHTHPGPGIRYLLEGTIRIASEGQETDYAVGAPWFEAGSDPVHATAAADRPSAFVRVLLLPATWEGKRTIRYVDAADEEKPKLQRPTVFFDRGITLP